MFNKIRSLFFKENELKFDSQIDFMIFDFKKNQTILSDEEKSHLITNILHEFFFHYNEYTLKKIKKITPNIIELININVNNSWQLLNLMASGFYNYSISDLYQKNKKTIHTEIINTIIKNNAKHNTIPETINLLVNVPTLIDESSLNYIVNFFESLYKQNNKKLILEFHYFSKGTIFNSHYLLIKHCIINKIKFKISPINEQENLILTLYECLDNSSDDDYILDYIQNLKISETFNLFYFQKNSLSFYSSNKYTSKYKYIDILLSKGIRTFVISNPNIFSLEDYNPLEITSIKYFSTKELNNINKQQSNDCDLILNFFNETNFKENNKLEDIIPNCNKHILNHIKKEIQNNNYLPFLLIKEFDFIDAQKLFNKIQFLDFKYTIDTQIINLFNTLYKELLFFYTEEKSLNLLFRFLSGSKCSYQYIVDTIYSINMIQKHSIENNIVIKLIDNPKCIRDLHDFSNKIATKLNATNFYLKNQEKLDALNNIKLDENYLIKVPNNNFDLIDIGNYLNICVGSGFYSKRILSNECLIFTLYKNDKLMYCIEYSLQKNKIIQAKGQSNSTVPNDVLNKLRLLLNDWKLASTN